MVNTADVSGGVVIRCWLPLPSFPFYFLYTESEVMGLDYNAKRRILGQLKIILHEGSCVNPGGL